MKHIKIQIEHDTEYGHDNLWTQFYYGVLNKHLKNDEIAENSLLKAVEITTVISFRSTIDTLKVVKIRDIENIQYYNIFSSVGASICMYILYIYLYIHIYD